MLQHLSLLQPLHTLLLGVCLWSFITAILIGSLYLQSNKNTPHQRWLHARWLWKNSRWSHLLTVWRSILVIPKDPSPSMRMVRASGLATWQPKNDPNNLQQKKTWKIAWFNRYSPFFLQKKVCQKKNVAWAPMAKGKPAPITPKLPLVMKVRGLNFNFSQKFTKMVCFLVFLVFIVTSNHLSIELGPPDELTWHHLMIAHSCCHNDVLLLLFLKKRVNGFDHLTLKCWQKWIGGDPSWLVVTVINISFVPVISSFSGLLGLQFATRRFDITKGMFLFPVLPAGNKKWRESPVFIP